VRHAAERMERITADDRFARHADALINATRADLRTAADTIRRVLERMDTDDDPENTR
jgi:hypothetical protein